MIKESTACFPIRKTDLLISIAQLCSTSIIERTFSTLRRVKIYTRLTMTESILKGLCLMSVHRKLVLEKKAEIKLAVVEKFSANLRRPMLSYY